jgi:lipopolysaccharide export system protein LptC
MECSEFKSPVLKLLKFFRGSRDRWKAKCQQTKYDRKKVANQVRAVERSRERWKQKARAAEQRSRQLERELEELKTAVGA